jgi:hypothetical protein
VADGGVYLSGTERAIPLASITDAWLQRRSAGRGGKIGALVGASTGAALFGGGIALLSGLCEYDCNDDFGAGDVAVAALIGGAAGGAAGYLVGAIIGASVPRWEPLTETSAPARVVAREPRIHAGLSALSITGGAARAASHDDSGVMLSVSYLSQLSRHIALGGEIGRYGVTMEVVPALPCGDPEILCSSGQAGGGWTVGGLGRLGTGSHRSVEPYALLGLGVTDFGPVTLGSYTAGAGLRVRPGGGRVAVSAETRWHSNFTRSGDDSQLGLYTAGVTLSLLR